MDAGRVACRGRGRERGGNAIEGSKRVRQADRRHSRACFRLHDAGLERERATLLAGAAVFKELKPLTGVAFAIVTGFIVGRSFQARS
jgi:hypothetical protein